VFGNLTVDPAQPRCHHEKLPPNVSLTNATVYSNSNKVVGVAFQDSMNVTRRYGNLTAATVARSTLFNQPLVGMRAFFDQREIHGLSFITMNSTCVDLQPKYVTVCHNSTNITTNMTTLVCANQVFNATANASSTNSNLTTSTGNADW